MELQPKSLINTVKAYSNILIVIKGSPDPDAIASSFALKLICDNLNVSSDIVATAPLSLARNVEFVKLLDIPFKVKDKISLKNYDSYIVTDHQTCDLADIGDTIPCIVHIDHHEETESKVKPLYSIIDTSSGSTCTILSLLLKELNIDFGEENRLKLATALLYGIHTDTDKYEHASSLDYEAISYLTPQVDNDIFNRLTGSVLTGEMLHYLNEATSHQVFYRDWLITGLKYIDRMKRDTIAIVADYLLKREKAETVIVFAVIENTEEETLTIDASVRTKKESTNLNEMIKSITPNGGGRRFKGAFQVDINYFYDSPDRELLWEMILATTVEILKKRRDSVYISDIKGFYKNLSRKLKTFFSSKD